MHADGERGGQIFQHTVRDINVEIDELIPIITACGELGLHIGIAEFGKGCLINLHISAARCGERFEFCAIGQDHIVPEQVHIRVGGIKRGLITAAEMQSAGTGNGDFRRGFGARF